MGKSDFYIFSDYLETLSEIKTPVRSVCFLGFNGENELTRRIKAHKRDFYDLSLGNWEINSDWKLYQKYDLIISTRCPYFSKDPYQFISKCKENLNPRGHALIDWGLGDHWRFDTFKVGWTRGGETEWAYKDENYLHSCFWNEDVAKDIESKKFWNAVLKNKFGYSPSQTLTQVVEEEVPSIISYPTKKTKLRFLWPDAPQLYIITLIQESS